MLVCGLLVNHLLELGYRKIGKLCICYDPLKFILIFVLLQKGEAQPLLTFGLNVHGPNILGFMCSLPPMSQTHVHESQDAGASFVELSFPLVVYQAVVQSCDAICSVNGCRIVCHLFDLARGCTVWRAET